MTSLLAPRHLLTDDIGPLHLAHIDYRITGGPWTLTEKALEELPAERYPGMPIKSGKRELAT